MAHNLFKSDQITFQLVSDAFNSCLYGKHYDGFCSVTKPEHIDKLYKLLGYDIPPNTQTIVYVYKEFYDELTQAVVHMDEDDEYMEVLPPLVCIWFHAIYAANDNEKISTPIAKTLELIKRKKEPRLLITNLRSRRTGLDEFEVSMYKMGESQTSRERIQVSYDSVKNEEIVRVIGVNSVRT